MSGIAMREFTRAAFVGLCLGAALFAPAAHAGLFDDDEARRAILDIRAKIEQGAANQRAGQQQLTEQIDQLKRSLLDLNNQLEQVRSDNAKLRGQNEQLVRDVSEVQRKQKDIQSGVDDRLRKFEPQKVSLDGKEFSVEPDEKRQYDESMELLRKSDFAGTANALTAFRKRYPSSGYTESALFWLGNAQYGVRQYKEAIVSFRSLVSAAPDNIKAPEAMLAIANCQAELKDGKGARKTIDDLIKTYPKSEAAQAGRERLASLK
ncbi:MAG: tol-pal system protein YbgF [Pseudomonadota bacterium]